MANGERQNFRTRTVRNVENLIQNEAEIYLDVSNIEGDNETQNWIVSDDGKEDASSINTEQQD